MPRSRARRALGLAGWGLFIGALIVLWRDPGLLLQARHGTRTVADSDEGCRLAEGEPCTATFEDGSVLTLAVTGGLVPGKEAIWTVSAADPEVQVDGLEITGVSMPMGVTTLTLARQGAGSWQARGALPLCTASHTLWRADVLLHHGADRRIAGFQFWTGQGQAQAAEPGRGAAAPGPPPPTYGDFRVQTAAGDLALSDLRGNVVLLYFGYTACPDICPTTLSTLGAALAQLSDDQRARVVGLMVSLDPARDGLDRLEVYARHFDPSFRGGTTADEELDAISADWGVAWRITPLGDSALSYAVDHASFSLLIGPDGSLVGKIEHGTDPSEIAHRVAAVLSAAPPPG